MVSIGLNNSNLVSDVRNLNKLSDVKLRECLTACVTDKPACQETRGLRAGCQAIVRFAVIDLDWDARYQLASMCREILSPVLLS
jgi:hypothetical protein